MYSTIFITVISLYILLSIVILPLQYRFLVALKQEEAKFKAKGKTQGDMYDEMNAGEQALHNNIQGSALFFLANIMASIVYKLKHPKTSV
ncbi:DUF3949 domain-containing protein [Niallia taxi]|uniref:DUF3949 domain-containing protein n=1 Tax=Niallia taxi TaxID=2499688 RepID=UPI0023A9C709|nr:DUF3949 domain-containing protein [Niallia taxi]MDE5053860.1 DUF3949 domain-containing protein [Niallia taxi]MED3964113.1 DUF3949 domain-containing protein [Niallia taxi]